MTAYKATRERGRRRPTTALVRHFAVAMCVCACGGSSVQRSPGGGTGNGSRDGEEVAILEPVALEELTLVKYFERSLDDECVPIAKKLFSSLRSKQPLRVVKEFPAQGALFATESLEGERAEVVTFFKSAEVELRSSKGTDRLEPRCKVQIASRYFALLDSASAGFVGAEELTRTASDVRIIMPTCPSERVLSATDVTVRNNGFGVEGSDAHDRFLQTQERPRQDGPRTYYDSVRISWPEADDHVSLEAIVYVAVDNGGPTPDPVKKTHRAFKRLKTEARKMLSAVKAELGSPCPP